MKHLIAFIASTLFLCAQPTNVRVFAEHNRALIIFNRPAAAINAVCTVEVSLSSTFTPLVYDSDPILFTNADQDSRTGSIVQAPFVAFVAGGLIDNTLTSTVESRALQSDTLHYYRINCTGGSVSGKFNTKPTQLGGTYPCAPQYLSGSWSNLAQPSIDWASKAKVYVDPCTGVGWKRMSSEWAAISYGLNADAVTVFQAAIDRAGVWTTPNNALGASGFATVTATGVANSLALEQYMSGDQSLEGYDTNHAVTGFMVSINGSGSSATAADRTIVVGISLDDGQTMYGPGHDIILPQTTPSVTQYPATFTGASQFNGWLSAGQALPSTAFMMFRQGTADTSGTTLTLTGGFGNFSEMTPGQRLTLSGCAAAGVFVISSVTNSNVLVTTASMGTVSGCTWTMFPFAVMIYKKTGAGTISINTAKSSYLVEIQPVNADAGSFQYCSRTAAVDDLGVSGWACAPYTKAGGGMALYWIGSDGSSRLISRGSVTITGNALDIPITAYGNLPQMLPDPTTPTTWWGIAVTAAGKSVMLKCAYDAATGGWQEWSSPSYSTKDNPLWSCQNVTKPSLTQDLGAQMIALNAECDMSTSGGTMTVASIDSTGRTIISWAPQDLPGCLGVFNTATNLIERVQPTWNSYPFLHTANHQPAEPYGNGIWSFRAKPMGSAWQLPISTVTGTPGPGTAIASNYLDSRTCEAMGVTNPAFIAMGATGLNCIEITFPAANVRYAGAPAWMVTKWPSSVGGAAGGASWIITAGGCAYEAGTQFIDKFFVAFANSSRAVLMRNFSNFGINTNSPFTQALQAHPDGWALAMVPCSAGSSNSGGGITINSSTGAMAIDWIPMQAGHSDAQTFTSSTTLAEAGYQIRSGAPATQIGQAPFLSNNYSSTFNCDAPCSGVYFGMGVVIQSHNSCQNVIAGSSNTQTCFDGKPLGGLSGGGATVYHTINTTAVANVYEVGPPTVYSDGSAPLYNTWDPKLVPPSYWGGRYVVKDISGVGSVLGTGDAQYGCRAYQNDECVPGSTIGKTYMNIPKAYIPNLTGPNNPCNVRALGVFTPCWVPVNSGMFNLTQFGTDYQDTQGNNWRQLGTVMAGQLWNNGFWQPRPTPDGRQLIINGMYNGYKFLQLVAKVPEYVKDTVNRNRFVSIPIRTSFPTGTSIRVEFGYSEYDRGQLATGAVPRCNQYNAACYAGGSTSPYAQAPDAPSRTTCTTGTLCTVNIPAIPSRIVYYRIISLVGSAETAGPVQIVAAP